jgi:YHS domain-containing protein
MKLGLVSAILPELSLEELLAFSALAREAPKQTRCPLMVDDEIDMEEFVVFKGVKVYMCCGSCKETWAKNPEYFAVVCQKQAPQLKAVASKEIKPLRQLFCPVYANMRVHPKSLFIEHEGRTIYFSKKRAVSRFQANPKKYLKNLP